MIKVNGKIIEPVKFPDGTKLLKQESCSNVTIKWYYESDDELVTLIFLTRHLRDNGATNIELSMLYVPNARFDRIKDSDEVLTLKYFAEVINWLSFNKVKILDPHSYVSSALFNNLTIYSPKDIINKFIEDNFLDEISLNNFSLFFPDEGACKRYSGMFNNAYTFGLKRRDWKTGEIQGLDIIGDEELIKDKTILIIDDICSKGGTFYHSAKKLKELGAKDVYLYITHCENTILEGDLLTSGLIKKVFTTNTIFTKEHEMIEVIKL